MAASGMHTDELAGNLFDGGAPFYNVYETADGGYVSVAPIEPHFYALLLEQAWKAASGRRAGEAHRLYERVLQLDRNNVDALADALLKLLVVVDESSLGAIGINAVRNAELALKFYRGE